VRRTKTEAKVSQRAGVSSLTVTAPAETLTALEAALDDVLEAGSIASHDLRPGSGPLLVAVVLAED
jgi:valyl-tRNA synthetase